MAYDEGIASRIRERVSGEDGITEKKMFGGLAFLVHGNMACTASYTGAMLVRFEKDQHDAVLAEPHMGPMGKKRMRGFAYLSAEGCADEALFDAWVARSVAYARSLPKK